MIVCYILIHAYVYDIFMSVKYLMIVYDNTMSADISRDNVEGPPMCV